MGCEGVFERLCLPPEGGGVILILALRERGLYGDVGEVGREAETARVGDVGFDDGKS